MLGQKLACSRNWSYVKWTNTVYVVTDPFISLWPSFKPFSPKISTITPLKNFRQLQSRPTPHPPEKVRLLIKRLRGRRKSINVWINSETRIEKTLASPLPSALIAELGKTYFRLYTSTIIEKDTIRETSLSLEKICQKTNISLGNLCSNDWY